MGSKNLVEDARRGAKVTRNMSGFDQIISLFWKASSLLFYAYILKLKSTNPMNCSKSFYT